MIDLLNNIELKVNSKVYLKNPESSALGKRIVTGSIELIDELGYDDFTFRKLAKKISTSEASVYRYFESKHKLLLYITSWYWSWLNYRLTFELHNIKDPKERLSKAVKLLTEKIEEDNRFSHVNEVKLMNIVVHDASKSFLSKHVDEENKDGVFSIYKDLVNKIGDIILEIKPDYLYPQMLVSTVIEGAHLQRYFAEHLPRLTNCVEEQDAISCFYHDLVFNALSK